MIRYALRCAGCAAEFEAWFASSAAYQEQSDRGLVACAECGARTVEKQIMAPAVSGTTKRAARPDVPPEKLRAFVESARKHVSENFDYVGDRFAAEARAMYYGESEERAIWGETTVQEAKDLADEGVPAAPLPAPLAPKPPKSNDRLN